MAHGMMPSGLVAEGSCAQVNLGFFEQMPPMTDLASGRLRSSSELGSGNARAMHRLQQLVAGQAEAEAQSAALKEAQASSDEGIDSKTAYASTESGSEAKAGIPCWDFDSDYDANRRNDAPHAPKDVSDVGRLLCENARLALENEHLRLVYENQRLKSIKESMEPKGPCFLPLPVSFMMPPSVVCMPPTIQADNCEMPAEMRTTVTLRNLPNNYTRAMFLNMLNSEGFEGAYDFIYLPIDFYTQACLGYAFVNLVNPSLVANFWYTFDGFSKWVIPSQKVCNVSWSTPYQGLDAHIDRYKNSPLMHSSVPDECKPMVFQNGLRLSFPLPTKAIRAPRMRTALNHHVRFRGGSGRARHQ